MSAWRVGRSVGGGLPQTHFQLQSIYRLWYKSEYLLSEASLSPVRLKLGVAVGLLFQFVCVASSWLPHGVACRRPSNCIWRAKKPPVLFLYFYTGCCGRRRPPCRWLHAAVYCCCCRLCAVALIIVSPTVICLCLRHFPTSTVPVPGLSRLSLHYIFICFRLLINLCASRKA